MTTDRDMLVRLVDAVERGDWKLLAVLNEAREYLTRQPDGDCSTAVERASRAAYAAGVAHGVGARPDRRQGSTVQE